MAGLSCAQRLIESGRQVTLIEQDFCGSGASGKSSGFITPDSEIELSSLIANYGPIKAKRLWEFVLSGVDLIRHNIEHYQIACDYQLQDSLFIANSHRGQQHVTEENKARQNLGYQSTLYSKDSLNSIIGSAKFFSAVRYPQTFGINSYLYCQGLKDILVDAGLKVFEQTPALKIVDHLVTTPNGQIEAQKIIICADRWLPNLIPALKPEIYHVQTFLGITSPLTPTELKSIFPTDHLMVWDTSLIYNYFRITGDNRLLIGGGDLVYTYAKNQSNNTTRAAARLTHYLKTKFPHLNLTLTHVWPGLLGVTPDLLPILGTLPQNPHITYLSCATGLPWAAALGHLTAELIIEPSQSSALTANKTTELSSAELLNDFSPTRKFPLNPRLASVISTPLTFATSHVITKYL